MEVEPTASQAILPTEKDTENGMGREQFLKLFLAQLSNQDPLNPVDDKAFIAQLAQFSQLEQTMETNRRLGLLESAQTSMVSSQTTLLIGQDIRADQETLTLRDGQAPNLNFELQGNATTVNLQIEDMNGRVVRNLPMGALPKGNQTVSWNGLNDSGVSLQGEYRLKIAALNGDASVASTAYVQGTVSGVSLAQGYPILLVGDQKVRPADVVEVLLAQSTTGGG